MSNQDEQSDEELCGIDSDYAPPREDGRDGPPDDWKKPSWFNSKTLEWWWRGRLDPCPVEPLGHIDGVYFFITGAGEVRRFNTNGLHSNGGPSDLFGGQLWWALRHFRKWDPGKEVHVGGLQKLELMAAMIRACGLIGYYDTTRPFRSFGTWRGPDGTPVVHTGKRIFYNGELVKPGRLIGNVRYVLGAERQAPAHALTGDRSFEWRPGPLALGHNVLAHLDRWNWQDVEGRDLFLGGLCCDMLGDAVQWKVHRFIRAQAGAGKTSLLRYMQALLGDAAHPIQRTYTRARLEQRFSNTSCAILLDEMESDSDAEKLRKVFELIRLLSDDGATGGRGTPGGVSREIDLHGTVAMVATLREAWRPQDRSRIAYIELKPLVDREIVSPEQVNVMLEEAARMSAALRARIIAKFDLFKDNLSLARKRILELGGSPRDGDQLGHLIAGWATMTSDAPLSEDEVRELERFTPYIMTLTEQEDGMDDASECLNTLLGLPVQVYRGGEQFTIGQLIARARAQESDDMRRALLPYGLRLEKLKNESWPQGWLAIANRHPGLDKLFGDYPDYRGPKRSQILGGLRRMVGGIQHEAKPSHGALRFAGPQSRAVLVPPLFLPSIADERQEEP